MKYYPFKQNGSYGIIDEKGNIIEPAGNYSMVGYFYGEYTTVSDAASREEKIWHGKSTTKIPLEVYYLFDISDGLAKAATEDHVCGYINLSGEWQIPCKYYRCSQFVNGYAVVSNQKEGKFGIISKDHAVVIDFYFDHINPWSKYGTTARLADKWFYLSPSFGVVEFGEADFLCSPTIEGVFRYQKHVKRKVVAGFAYIDGTPAFTEQVFSGTRVWGAGFGGVKCGKAFSFVDRNGHLYQDNVFADVGFFHNGLCPAREFGNRRKWGAINEKFEWVIPPIYEGCDHLHPDLANEDQVTGKLMLVWFGNYVLDDGAIGYYDYQGNVVWEPSR